MLTKQGKNMSAALYGKKITFTACRCGYSDEALTETSSIIPIKDMEILEADYKNGRTCVSTRLTNDGIKEVTNVNQIGLYAKLENEDEHLFYIWQTDEMIVLGKDDVLKIKDYDLYLTVSSLGNATIEVNTSNYLRKEHNADSKAHQDIRKDIGNVKNNIIDINMEITSLKKELGENLDKVANVLTEIGVATGEKMTLEELETILREKIGAELKDKPKLAEAITSKGILTDKNDTIEKMAENVLAISSELAFDDTEPTYSGRIINYNHASSTHSYEIMGVSQKGFIAQAIENGNYAAVGSNRYYIKMKNFDASRYAMGDPTARIGISTYSSNDIITLNGSDYIIDCTAESDKSLKCVISKILVNNNELSEIELINFNLNCVLASNDMYNSTFFKKMRAKLFIYNDMLHLFILHTEFIYILKFSDDMTNYEVIYNKNENCLMRSVYFEDFSVRNEKLQLVTTKNGDSCTSVMYDFKTGNFYKYVLTPTSYTPNTYSIFADFDTGLVITGAAAYRITPLTDCTNTSILTDKVPIKLLNGDEYSSGVFNFHQGNVIGRNGIIVYASSSARLNMNMPTGAVFIDKGDHLVMLKDNIIQSIVGLKGFYNDDTFIACTINNLLFVKVDKEKLKLKVIKCITMPVANINTDAYTRTTAANGMMDINNKMFLFTRPDSMCDFMAYEIV